MYVHNLAWVFFLLGTVECQCPQQWTSHSSSCYFFSTFVSSWTNAKEYCKEFGGYLAEITTAAENTYIKNLAQHNYHTNTSHGVKIYGYWLGGKQDPHGNWFWDGTGDRITQHFWYPREPNNINEQCMHINSQEQFMWNDYLCTANEYFICEKSESGEEIIG